MVAPRRYEILDGIEATRAEIEECAEWMKRDDGRLFWRVLDSLRASAHNMALRKPGETYTVRKGGALGTEEVRMIPEAVRLAQISDAAASERAYSRVIEAADILTCGLPDGDE